jgi:hypothetical protein
MDTMPQHCTMQRTADAKQLTADDKNFVEGAAPGDKKEPCSSASVIVLFTWEQCESDAVML